MARSRWRVVCSDSICGTARDPSGEPFVEDCRQIFNCNALLFHRIAIAQRHCIAQRRIFFPQRLEINGDPEGRTNFILTPIPTADGPALIIENSHMRSQKSDNLFCFRDQLRVVLEQRKYPALYWSHPRMKT